MVPGFTPLNGSSRAGQGAACRLPYETLASAPRQAKTLGLISLPSAAGPLASIILVVGLAASARPEDEKKEVKEKPFDAPNGLTIKVRMEGPYDADTPLQVVCYFKHKQAGDKTLGAAVELDKKLGGVIASLRNRDEVGGDELETLLLTPPKDTIKPKMLLLVGLGDEDSLSLERMERVGKIALREAAKLGVKRAAFAPLLRDQGNAKFGTGDVAQAVT